MTNNISGSAKIYTFPPRGRFALRIGDAGAVVSPQLPRGVKFVPGSGWYHDEAIQEAAKGKAEQGRKN